MNTFGKVIRFLRKSSGMTLEFVARKIGSHKGYVSGIENEKVNPPSVKFCRKLAKLFAPEILRMGFRAASEEDFVELSWVSKAPKIVRSRLLQRVEMFTVDGVKRNPLAFLVVPGIEQLPAPKKRAAAVAGR